MSVDHFKEMSRRYDRAVVAKGGVSIFGTPYPDIAPERLYLTPQQVSASRAMQSRARAPLLSQAEIAAYRAVRHRSNNPNGGGDTRRYKPSAFRVNTQVSAHHLVGWDDEA